MNAAILAGGQSRRMGRDKTALDWDGASLLDRAVASVRAAGATNVAVAGGETAPAGCVRLADAVRGRGPLGGILAAVRWRPRVLVLACDMPLVETTFLRWLEHRAEGFAGWTLPESQPLCAVYTAALLPWLERAAARPTTQPTGSLSAILAAAPRQILTAGDLAAHGFDPSMFANLNTPAEYEAARSLHV